MPICWHPINEPTPRKALSMLSSSTINTASSPIKRDKGFEEVEKRVSPQDLQSSPLRELVRRKKRPPRSVKLVRSIEPCKSIPGKVISRGNSGKILRSPEDKAGAISRMRTAITNPQQPTSQPSQDPITSSTSSTIYTPTHISVHPHHGTTKSSLPWTKTRENETPLVCPPELCEFIRAGATVSLLENKLGKDWDDVIERLGHADAARVIERELEVKLGIERTRMVVTIAKIVNANKKIETGFQAMQPQAPEQKIPSESPLFVSQNSSGRKSRTQTSSPSNLNVFALQETPITPSISRLQNSDSHLPCASIEKSNPVTATVTSSPISTRASSPAIRQFRASITQGTPSQPLTPPPSSPPNLPRQSTTVITHGRLKSEPTTPASTFKGFSPAGAAEEQQSQTRTPQTFITSAQARLQARIKAVERKCEELERLGKGKRKDNRGRMSEKRLLALLVKACGQRQRLTARHELGKRMRRGQLGSRAKPGLRSER